MSSIKVKMTMKYGLWLSSLNLIPTDIISSWEDTSYSIWLMISWASGGAIAYAIPTHWYKNPCNVEAPSDAFSEWTRKMIPHDSSEKCKFLAMCK